MERQARKLGVIWKSIGDLIFLLFDQAVAIFMFYSFLFIWQNEQYKHDTISVLSLLVIMAMFVFFLLVFLNVDIEKLSTTPIVHLEPENIFKSLLVSILKALLNLVVYLTISMCVVYIADSQTTLWEKISIFMILFIIIDFVAHVFKTRKP